MVIAINFASRSRPNKFFNCLDNIRSTFASKEYFVWAKLDEDDAEIEKYKSRLNEYPEVTVKWGLSKGKIHAVNRDISDLPPFDILLNESDDFWFLGFGVDNIIRDAMRLHSPELDIMLHFPDQKAKERTCTYQIVGRKYFERTGYVYNPEYISIYADNEETEKAKMLGKYAFINRSIFEHRHPTFGGYGEIDDLLKKTESKELYRIDRETFMRRKSMNFGISRQL